MNLKLMLEYSKVLKNLKDKDKTFLFFYFLQILKILSSLIMTWFSFSFRINMQNIFIAKV